MLALGGGTMFEELDRLLSKEISDDSWYDDGCLIAEDMMLKFSMRIGKDYPVRLPIEALHGRRNWHIA